MVNISASILDQLKDWIESQIENGSYTSTSDYLRDLIRNDKMKKQELDDMLLEGIKSNSIEVDESYWTNKKDKIKAQFDR